MSKAKTSRRAEEKIVVKKPTIEQFDLIIRPIITEKTMALMQDQNKVTVEVSKKANKQAIKDAFAAVFEVEVVAVKIINTVAKKTRRGGRHEGTIPAVKKAIVTVKEGQAIDLFRE
ncbi:MAG TPA: 50S ribosomal protein L23 [Bacilli bacterium]|nr:50S ribosomal protein L23 [Bacilli bacterium]